METKFDASGAEPRIYEAWERAGAFRAGANARPGAESFCIVIPPPNVTGSLHMGHAFNNTLQDILIRWHRMRGFDTLWQPGTDHAGIATQMVTEREMAANGEPTRAEMGREAFVNRVWQQKVRSRGTIIGQLKRLGASCDWSREAFTMGGAPGDPESGHGPDFHDAVIKVFVEMYNKGLIYRGKRLVNWDPHFETAISDLEVEQVEVDGHMWRLRYPLENGATYEHPTAWDENGTPTAFETRDYLVVATTRPETMLGDTGVAVHPDDPRYRHLIGKTVRLPIVGRSIPIVADSYADPEKGTGAVKITPAHDFNDWEVGQRAGLRVINVMSTRAAIALRNNADFAEGCDPDDIARAVEMFDGRDRYEARDALVTRARDEDWLDGIDADRHMVPHGDRSKTAVEPFLTDQWFVDAAKIVGPAIDAVKTGAVRILPEQHEKVYFHWLENIEPWCISRQLWWGHQVPVWYGRDGATFCAPSFEEAAALASAHYDCPEIRETELSPDFFADEGQRAVALPGAGVHSSILGDNPNARTPYEFIARDPDVLDTWFSSGLWPIGTLGWPGKEPVWYGPSLRVEISKDGKGSMLWNADAPVPFTAPTFEKALELAQAHYDDLCRDLFEEGGPYEGDSPYHELVEEEASSRAERKRGVSKNGGLEIQLWRDPKQTLGTDALDRYFPTSVLITGFDIIFFWVARMMMMQYAVVGEKPFDTVYVHALVRDEKGKKMSKSLGNVLDPLDLIDEYGADAVRFTLTSMAAMGRDLKLSKDRIAGYRNFGTKLWNAVRFAEMNGVYENGPPGPEVPAATATVNRWIIGETARIREATDAALAAYRFNDAANGLYAFVWGKVCDWYVEFAKPLFGADDPALVAETRATMGWVLDQCMILLHPIMPFITEELWQATGDRPKMLIHADWPAYGTADLLDEDADREMTWVIGLIDEIRSLRAQMRVPVAAQLPLLQIELDAAGEGALRRTQALVQRIARIDSIGVAAEIPKGALTVTVPGGVFALPVAGTIDIGAEIERLEKLKAKHVKEAGGLAARLANEKFLASAPDDVIAEARDRAAEIADELERLDVALDRLAGLR